jgi:hypothetical protein
MSYCCLNVSLLFAICLLLFMMFYFLFYVFNYSFYVCFLVLYGLLSILCVLCYRIVLCIVSPHVYLYGCLLFICIQFYRPLPPGGGPVAVRKYRMLWCNKLRAPRTEQFSEQMKDMVWTV